MARLLHLPSKNGPPVCLSAGQAQNKTQLCLHRCASCATCSSHWRMWLVAYTGKWDWKIERERNYRWQGDEKSRRIQTRHPPGVFIEKQDAKCKLGMSWGWRSEDMMTSVPGISAVHKLCYWKTQGSGSLCQLLHLTVPRSKSEISVYWERGRGWRAQQNCSESKLASLSAKK